MTKRIEYLDAIKGFAIFLMVMGHAIAWNYADYNEICIFKPEQPTNIKMGGVVWQLIYSFHMPLFFMISGFLSYKNYCWQDFGAFIKKKFKRLFIPWIFTFVIAYLVRDAMGYWFLLCLFEIAIFCFPIIVIMRQINKKSNGIIDIIIGITIYILLRVFHIQELSCFGIEVGRFANAFLPFFVGIMLRRHNKFFNICVKQPLFNSCAFALFIIIFVSRYIIGISHVFEYIHHYGTIILPILGSLVVFYAFANEFLKRFQSLLTYIGKKTLSIYIFHLIFVLQFNGIGVFILNQNAVTSVTLQIVYATINSVIAIVLSLFCYRLLSVNPMLKRLLFGE